MKKIYLSILSLSLAAGAYAQSAVDAYQLSPSDFRGTARFMSMGGAFTALGGDISTLNQNPAGIGIYRKSEIGITLDINMAKTDITAGLSKYSEDKTRAYCNNFGYVGAINLDSDIMRTFNWGVSYSRVASFDRTYRAGMRGNYVPISNSVTNYIASFTNQPASVYEYDKANKYNPYYDGNGDWLSILAYQGFLISNNGNSTYNGLWGDKTTGGMSTIVREKGYVDEYSIDFGGNVSDIVYWGVGFGITDIRYTQSTDFQENLKDARIPNESTGYKIGDGTITLGNDKLVTGSGFNFKTGLIIKPINELRLGIAVHTPTYYKLSQDFRGYATYNYPGFYNPTTVETEAGYFDWKLQTPWKLMFGVAGVVGGRAILSADYEYAAYNKMEISDRDDMYDYSLENQDIENIYKPQHTFRIGAEYRVTPEFSVRAGYNHQSSAVEKDLYNANIEVATSGTNPAYTLDNTTQYITLGLGYRYKAFYADLAYVHKDRESSYNTFTNYDGNQNNAFKMNTKENNIVLSIGVKF